MSNLVIIERALQSNPKIIYGKTQDDVNLPERSDPAYFVGLWVAPKDGLWTPEDLNEFMGGLVTGLEPTEKAEFAQHPDYLSLGAMHYDQEIGSETVTRDIRIDVPELQNLDRMVDGKLRLTEKITLIDRTWIDIFPSEEIARDFFDHKLALERKKQKFGLDHYRISTADLARYQSQ